MLWEIATTQHPEAVVILQADNKPYVMKLCREGGFISRKIFDVTEELDEADTFYFTDAKRPSAADARTLHAVSPDRDKYLVTILEQACRTLS